MHYLPTPLPARSVGAAARFLVELPAAATSWGQAFRRFRPHVVHVQCFGPNGVYAARLARLTRTPLIVSSHGETFMDDHAAFEHSALLRGALDRALHGACRVTGCSQVVLDDLATGSASRTERWCRTASISAVPLSSRRPAGAHGVSLWAGWSG